MGDKAVELQRRTTSSFALRVVRLFRSLPNCPESRVVGHQLLRSATSVAANHRAACRARSRPDFLHKLGIVEEESDETLFWLEVVGSRPTAKEKNRQSAIGNRKSVS